MSGTQVQNAPVACAKNFDMGGLRHTVPKTLQNRSNPKWNGSDSLNTKERCSKSQIDYVVISLCSGLTALGFAKIGLIAKALGGGFEDPVRRVSDLCHNLR